MATEIKITIKLPSIEGIKKLSRFLFKNLKTLFWFFVKDIKTKKKRGILALIIAGFFFWQYDLNAGLLWLLFLLFLFYGWENRIIAVLALISLASCPILLSLKKDALAEQMAIYAYFFLVMTVVLQIVEYRKDLKNGKINEEE